MSISNRFLHVNLYPEGDRTCHIMVHTDSDDGSVCKQPIGYRPQQPLTGLMRVKNFNDGGNEAHDSRVLLCVKSVGQRKRGQLVLTDTIPPINRFVNLHK